MVGACICIVLISVQLKSWLRKSLRTVDIAVLESSHHAMPSFIIALLLHRISGILM